MTNIIEKYKYLAEFTSINIQVMMQRDNIPESIQKEIEGKRNQTFENACINLEQKIHEQFNQMNQKSKLIQPCNTILSIIQESKNDKKDYQEIEKREYKRGYLHYVKQLAHKYKDI